MYFHTCSCWHVFHFALKRSMYDYKLYVSLLIFVYSLMDSDERASLQKKMFQTKQSLNIFHEHVVQYPTVTITMHVAFLTCCAFKKKNQSDFMSCDISLQACGGWAGSSQNCGCRISSFSLPTSFPTPFLPQFRKGRNSTAWGKAQCLGQTQRWDVHLSKHQWMI